MRSLPPDAASLRRNDGASPIQDCMRRPGSCNASPHWRHPAATSGEGADLENVGKAALDLLAAQLERSAGDGALQPGPVIVAPGGGIAVPAGEALRLLLGYARR